jgi:hypothetical protein
MHRTALVAAALIAPAAGATAAGAATLRVDRGCYLAKQTMLPNGQQIVARADGFAPGAPVTFALPTGSVALVAANASGTAIASFSAPGLTGITQFKATRTLTATDGAHQASTRIQLRLLAADFAPATSRNAAAQKVRFYVYGFGPVLTAFSKPTRQKVYMHVFEPGGRRRGTFAVGHTSGACGDLRTARRKILPFGLKNGTWTYRFTTAKRYRAKSLPQAEVGFRVRTVFQPA